MNFFSYFSYFNYTAWHDDVSPGSAQLLRSQVLLVLPHPKRVQTPPKQLAEPLHWLDVGPSKTLEAVE